MVIITDVSIGQLVEAADWAQQLFAGLTDRSQRFTDAERHILSRTRDWLARSASVIGARLWCDRAWEERTQ